MKCRNVDAGEALAGAVIALIVVGVLIFCCFLPCIIYFCCIKPN